MLRQYYRALVASGLALCVVAALCTPTVAQQKQARTPAPAADAPPAISTEPSVVVPGAPPAAAPQAAAPAPKKAPVAKKKPRGPGKVASEPVPLPPPEVLAMIVRGIIANVNAANYSENYDVLHVLTTPMLQKRITPTQLAKAFKPLRDQNTDLSPALVLPLQFTTPPSVSAKNELRLAGFVPSRPQQINFDITLLPVDNRWLADVINISTSAPADVAQKKE